MKDDDKRSIRRSAEAIIGGLDGEHPSFLIISRIIQLFRVGWAADPEAMTRGFSEFMVEQSRQYVGRCTECDADIPAKLSHPPMCNNCKNETELECMKIDMELEDEP